MKLEKESIHDGKIKNGWSKESKKFFDSINLLNEGNLKKIYKHLKKNYFNKLNVELPKINEVQLKFSRRLTSSAGNCNLNNIIIKISEHYSKRFPKEIPSIIAHEMSHFIVTDHGDKFNKVIYKLQQMRCQVYRYSRTSAKSLRQKFEEQRKKREKRILKRKEAKYKIKCAECGWTNYLKRKSKKVKEILKTGETRCYGSDCKHWRYYNMGDTSEFYLYIRNNNNDWKLVKGDYIKERLLVK